MNTSSSEWSSGCESGWTDYFDDLFQSPNQYHRGVYDNGRGCKASYEDEEDLSMVSDASSGPPHFHHYEEEEEEEEEEEGDFEWFRKDGFSCSSLSKEKSKRERVKVTRGKQQDLCLDDTASSPIFSCHESCVDSSSNQQSISHGGDLFISTTNLDFGGVRWNTKRLDSAEPRVICGGRKRK